MVVFSRSATRSVASSRPCVMGASAPRLCSVPGCPPLLSQPTQESHRSASRYDAIVGDNFAFPLIYKERGDYD